MRLLKGVHRDGSFRGSDYETHKNLHRIAEGPAKKAFCFSRAYSKSKNVGLDRSVLTKF